MKKLTVFIWVISIGMFLFSTPSGGTTIGPGTLPSWHLQAQVQLGWVFDNPRDPGNSPPLSGWDKAIGAIPVWDYNAARQAWGSPAQWYILIANLNNNNPVKHFWISWVHEFETSGTGPRIATNVDWTPPDYGCTNTSGVDEWFDSSGSLTTDPLLAKYGRFTWEFDIFPNPVNEEIWLGMFSAEHNALEVYIKTQCVPIPGAVWLLGSGLLGLIGLKRKFLG